MIIGMGTDIVQIKRIDLTIKRYGHKFLNRIFTPAERAAAEKLAPQKQTAYYAKRYAAKEAASKALGSGIGHLAMWQEMEILNNKAGAPVLTFSGQTLEYLKNLANKQPTRIFISLSDDEAAIATVILEV